MMKNIRTMLATLAGVFLAYGLFALVAFRSGAALNERTLYQVFAQSYFVILVMGVAMVLVAILLTIAMVSFKDDKDEDEEEEDDDDLFAQPKPRPAPVRQPVPARPAPAPRPAPKPVTRPLAPSIFDEDDEDDDLEEELPVRLPPSPRGEVGKADRGELPKATPPSYLPEDEAAYSRPAPEPRRCVFCDEVISGNEPYCPYCGKKQ
ncbi:MAG: hypothetical protein FWE69_03415 [Clostridiales bacterium]|nr:hypothetical protein [Clostridiales bacterium]